MWVMDDTIVVTRSNKRANIFNQGIRNMVLDRDEELSQGDILMNCEKQLLLDGRGEEESK